MSSPLFAVAAAALFCAVATETAAAQARGFATIRRGELVRDGRPLRNVGANLPDLFLRFLAGEDQIASAQLRRAAEHGVRVVRCFGSSWHNREFPIFFEDRARWLGAFDRMLAAADSVGISVVPSLLFNANMVPWHVTAQGGPPEGVASLFTPGTRSNQIALEYVTVIVTRYRNDPRVLFWEIGNEYNLEVDLSREWKDRPDHDIPTSDQLHAFLVQMAKHIKAIDPNHLVTSGNSDMRPYAWHIRQAMLAQKVKADKLAWKMDWRSDTYEQYVEMLRYLNPPPLDILSIHSYPTGKETPPYAAGPEDKATMLAWNKRAAREIGQPLFIGEFGQTVWKDGAEVEAPWLADFLRQIPDARAPLALIWSWEFDEENPTQSPYTLSPTRTPRLAAALKRANQRLRR